LSPRKNTRRGKVSPKTSKTMTQPSQIKSNVGMSHLYRFTSSSGTTTNITPVSLSGAAGTICVIANSTVRSMFGSVRLNSIEIWTPVASIGSFATCSVEWLSTLTSSNTKEVSDTSTSISYPAHLYTSPPSGSLARFWQRVDSTTPLCAITAPTGSIIDVSISTVLSDNDVTANIVVTTATIAVIYYLSLDDNATHRYVPVSLTTTT
jgi:hypothetical protein